LAININNNSIQKEKMKISSSQHTKSCRVHKANECVRNIVYSTIYRVAKLTCCFLRSKLQLDLKFLGINSDMLLYLETKLQQIAKNNPIKFQRKKYIPRNYS